MPRINGHVDSSAAASHRGGNVLAYTTALDVLKEEYPQQDGIDVQTLLDSKRNGGLAYNDFLMLPGYIG